MILSLILLIILLASGLWYGSVLHNRRLTTNGMIRLPKIISEILGSRSNDGIISYQGLLLQLISIIFSGVMIFQTTGIISGQDSYKYLMWSIGILLLITILLSALRKW